MVNHDMIVLDVISVNDGDGDVVMNFPSSAFYKYYELNFVNIHILLWYDQKKN